MFNHKYRYLFILALSLYTYLGTVLCKVYYYFDLQIEWYYALATITAITALTWEMNHLLQIGFNKLQGYHNNEIKKLTVFFLIACVDTTIITCLVVFFMSMVIHQYTFNETLIPLKLNLIYAWLANLLFHLINAIMFYFSGYKSKQMEAEALKRMSAQAELQVVKNQLNPHFLFNNLNVLSSLILQNNAEANRFIEEFSKVYRYILGNHDKELVPLKTELHFINPYIFLLQKRFSDGLQVDLTIDHHYQDMLIVPASLQLLIENAIKHNVVSRQKPLHITVHTNGSNTLVVSNNLQTRQSIENSTGIGLQNIIKRYSLVSNREVMVKHNQSEFIVTLPLIHPN